MASAGARTEPRILSAKASEGSSLVRPALSLLLVIIAGVCAVVFLLSARVLTVENLTSDALLRERLGELLRPLGLGQRAALAGGSLLVGLASLWGVGALMRSGRRSRSRGASRYHLVEANEHGLLVVDNGSVETLARTAVGQVQGIFNVEVSTSGGGSQAISLDVQADVIGGVDLKRVGREAGNNARRAIENLAGLNVADVTVRLSVEEPRRFLEGLE